jgi:DNA-binding Lrp family transcriptional regulator
MPMGFVNMLSEADHALLSLLRENARASTAELARKLRVSRTTVQSRIERLEKRGMIRGYSVQLSPEYEQNLVKAHVLVTALPKLAMKVEATLRKIAWVRTLHSVSGQFEIGALEGVERTMSSIILSTRIDR